MTHSERTSYDRGPSRHRRQRISRQDPCKAEGLAGDDHREQLYRKRGHGRRREGERSDGGVRPKLVDTEEVKAERYGARKRPFNGTLRRRTPHESKWTFNALARFCDCKCWHSGSELVFFGSAPDTENAHNLADIIRMTMESEFQRYLGSYERDPSPSMHGRALRTSFMLGMARRVSERLDAMRAARGQRTQAAPASRALVVIAMQQVVTEKYAEYLRARGMRVGKARGGHVSNRSQDAYDAGAAAGGRVGLGKMIGG